MPDLPRDPPEGLPREWQLMWQIHGPNETVRKVARAAVEAEQEATEARREDIRAWVLGYESLADYYWHLLLEMTVGAVKSEEEPTS